jgi:S-adenosylmethionine:tRNA ribosyltransferase-isomerase
VHPRHLRISDYTYELPNERIARHPMPERDAAQMLVYKGGDIRTSTFRSLPDELPTDSLLLLNQTKVVPARILFQKPSGGFVEVFCLEPDARYADVATALMQQGQVYWRCLVGGASKWKRGMILEKEVAGIHLRASISAREEEAFVIEFSWAGDAAFAEVLQRVGAVPLPPYLGRTAEEEDAARYQTVFARAEGSVAAPTASLHFSESLLTNLAARGVRTAACTLHVGAGTFKPVKSETVDGHLMHAEWIEVDAAFVEALIENLDRTIVAVGTTAMRTAESLYWIGRRLAHRQAVELSGIAVSQWEPYEVAADISPKAALEAVLSHIQTSGGKLVTRTQILIAPGYDFKVVRGLVTNFHQPESTLLLLVAAFIGKDWRRVYDYALENDFRFLSYGDGSLLWRQD